MIWLEIVAGVVLFWLVGLTAVMVRNFGKRIV